MTHLTADDLQVGKYIWWTTTGQWKNWDGPGIITYVNHQENKFKVFTFDDMTETDDISIVVSCDCDNNGYSALLEMREANRTEVITFIKKQTNLYLHQIELHQRQIDTIAEKAHKTVDIQDAIINYSILEFIKIGAK